MLEVLIGLCLPFDLWRVKFTFPLALPTYIVGLMYLLSVGQWEAILRAILSIMFPNIHNLIGLCLSDLLLVKFTYFCFC